VSWFTVTYIKLYIIPVIGSFNSSSLTIKSIAINVYSSFGVNSNISNLYSLCVAVLNLLQILYSLTTLFAILEIKGK
jgi:hypothetical protein